MVWSMDVQIAKLHEGTKHLSQAEDTVARMEKLAQDTTGQLSAATTAREEWTREFARLERDSRGLSEHLKSTVERLAVDKRSEEHTSELQSQSNLVCRLLLEKKKK